MCGNCKCEWIEVTTKEETTRRLASDTKEVAKRVQFNTAQSDESTRHLIQETGELVNSILT
ncbi:hypothetical protein CPK_ORF00498 [Chlamydia pneumoniae LPCoLN]|nr:hypothetical protein CPK_ORF00498 [Chlamydia pneumoniae LPCoLN]ETR79864.1 hypothetical protein X556_0805 [Chlamydia pneumoniae B21]